VGAAAAIGFTLVRLVKAGLDQDGTSTSTSTSTSTASSDTAAG